MNGKFHYRSYWNVVGSLPIIDLVFQKFAVKSRLEHNKFVNWQVDPQIYQKSNEKNRFRKIIYLYCGLYLGKWTWKRSEYFNFHNYLFAISQTIADGAKITSIGLSTLSDSSWRHHRYLLLIIAIPIVPIISPLWSNNFGRERNSRKRTTKYLF